MNFITTVFLVCCFLLFGSFSRASAYIDPATTSYVLELVVGAVVVGGAALGYYWRKIKSKVSKNEDQKTGVSVEEQLSGLDTEDDEDWIEAEELLPAEPASPSVMQERTECRSHVPESDAVNNKASFSEKLEGLVKGDWPFRKRLLLAILPSLAVSFILCFFGPLDLICISRNSLSYSALQVLPAAAAVTGITFAVLFLAASVPGGRIHAFLISLYTGAAAAMYIQGAVLNPDLGTMDGSVINWPGLSTGMVINAAVWFIILLVPFLLRYFSDKVWRTFVMFVCGALILMQAVSLGTKLWDQYGADRQAKTGYHISTENMLRVGRKNNIFVFLLDTVSSSDVQAMLDKYPDTLGLFHDFTSYDNANSHYMYTVPSLVDLFTGQEWDAENVHIADYMNDAWQSEEAVSFFGTLTKDGYERNIYLLLPEAVRDPAVLKETFSSLQSSENDLSIDKRALVKLYKLSLYRYCPIMMKPFFVVYTTDLMNLVTYPYSMNSEWDFVDRMNDTSLSEGSSDKAFFFYYLAGAHLPYRMDDRGRLISSDLAPEFNTNYSEKEDQLAGFFYLISEYIRQLKTMGLYDQAGIIILSDHGNNTAKDADHQPIYMAKLPGESHAVMESSSAPITIQDCFRADVMAMAGHTDGDKWGIPSSQVPDEPAERRTFAYARDDRYPPLDGAYYNVLNEYRYTGDSDVLTDRWVNEVFETIPMIDSIY